MPHLNVGSYPWIGKKFHHRYDRIGRPRSSFERFIRMWQMCRDQDRICPNYYKPFSQDNPNMDTTFSHGRSLACSLREVVYHAHRDWPSLSVFRGLSTYFQPTISFQIFCRDTMLHDTDGDERLSHMQPEFWTACPQELTTNPDPLAVWQGLRHRIAESLWTWTSFPIFHGRLSLILCCSRSWWQISVAGAKVSTIMSTTLFLLSPISRMTI